MALLEIQEVSKLYGFGEAATIALDEVNFSVDKNEFIAVMGPSGSGKSTLMNIIGFLDDPSHGSYKINGRLTSKMGSDKRAKIRRDTVGFVFQSYNLIQKMTVLENVALPLAYKGIGTVKRNKRAGELLDRVGLADKEYFYPSQLSGGQVQRVAIARALINNPSLIIADEPTGNLDSQSSRVIMELLSEVHKAGNTVLMVTHNPALTKYANRVVYMHDGVIIHDQKNTIGEIPGILKRSMYFVSRKTIDDDVAGVSALMKAIPGDLQKTSKSKKKKTTRKKRATKKSSSVKAKERKK